MRRILWIVPKCPLPADDGSRVACSVLIKGLKGEAIDLMLLAGKDELVDFSALRNELGVRNIYVVRRSNFSVAALIKAFFLKPLLPITVSKYATTYIKKALRRLLFSNDASLIPEISEIDERLGWSVVVFEGVHAAAFSSTFGRYKKLDGFRTIYRAQNCESDIWRSKAEQEKNVFKKLLLKYQSSRMRSFEESVVAAVDGLATVSDNDLVSLRARELAKNWITVPIGQKFTQLPKKEARAVSLLFVGKLDWQPNRDGLKWFLENVWDSLNGVNLRIIGSGNGSWLDPFLTKPRIEFLGRVPKLEPYYQECDAVIVPVFYGSGTRVKVIEAASYAKPCLGTELGVSGLGFAAGKHYLRAEEVGDWQAILSNVDLEQWDRVGKEAAELLKEDFSIESASAKFVTLLDRVSD